MSPVKNVNVRTDRSKEAIKIPWIYRLLAIALNFKLDEKR